MPVAIVSKNTVLRARLIAKCRERAFRNVSAHDESSDILETAPGSLVLLHATSSSALVATQIKALRMRFRGIRIVLLTANRVTDAIRRDLATKVEAVLPEEQSSEALIGALALVREGYRLVYGDDAAAAGDWAQAAQLSKRESSVLARLREGGSNKDIANDLGICEATVKVHLRACFRKIGAKNRTQAAIWAAERL